MAVHEYPQSHGSLAGLSDTDHHTQYALSSSGPAVSRPTGPWRFGRWYYATDTGGMSFDQGAGWVALATTQYAHTWAAAQTFDAGLTAKTGLSVANLPNASAVWNHVTVKATSLWGDGVSGAPGEDVGTTRYATIGAGGANGIMLHAPHVVWKASESLAETRYGRIGGTSAGTWWYAGAGTARVGDTNIGAYAIGRGDNAQGGVADNLLWIHGTTGETRARKGVRAAVDGNTSTSTGVDLFIDSLFA